MKHFSLEINWVVSCSRKPGVFNSDSLLFSYFSNKNNSSKNSEVVVLNELNHISYLEYPIACRKQSVLTIKFFCATLYVLSYSVFSIVTSSGKPSLISGG